MYKFQKFVFDAAKQTIAFDGSVEKLNHMQCQVLQMLIEHQGEVVSNNLIIEQVWRDQYSTGQKGLRQNIWSLRKILAQYDEQEIIKTVPRKGYIFTPEVDKSTDPKPQESIKGQVKNTTFMTALGAAVTIFVVIVLLTLFFAKEQSSELLAKDWHLNRLYLDDRVYYQPRFNSDGSLLTYIVKSPQAQEIYIDTIGTNDFTPNSVIKLHGKDIFSTAISPNNSLLAFYQKQQDSCQVIIHPLISNEKQRTIECSTENLSFNIDWLPDSKGIVYNDYDKQTLTQRIYRADLDGLSKIPLSENSGVAGFARISPNGKKVAYVNYIDSYWWTIKVVDIQTQQEVEILRQKTGLNQLTWSSDEVIYYLTGSRERPGVWAISLDDAKSQFVYPVAAVDMDFNSNSQRFIFNQLDIQSQIHQLSLNSHEVTPIGISGGLNVQAQQLSDGHGGYAFIKLDSGIYQIHLNNNGQNEKIFQTDTPLAEMVVAKEVIYFVLKREGQDSLKMLDIATKQVKEVAEAANIRHLTLAQGFLFYLAGEDINQATLYRASNDSKTVETGYDKQVGRSLTFDPLRGVLYFNDEGFKLREDGQLTSLGEERFRGLAKVKGSIVVDGVQYFRDVSGMVVGLDISNEHKQMFAQTKSPLYLPMHPFISYSPSTNGILYSHFSSVSRRLYMLEKGL